jgi:rare lipoprotein A (peptidoglycan hydrolase)
VPVLAASDSISAAGDSLSDLPVSFAVVPLDATNEAKLATAEPVVTAPSAPAATPPSVEHQPTLTAATPLPPATTASSPQASTLGNQDEVGQASWYGPYFHGRATASGETFDASARTVAHPSLPFGAVVAIENLANGRRVVARVNDRGPFSEGRIVDCSYVLAHDLGFVACGTAPVRLTVLDSIAPAAAFAGSGRLVPLCEEDRTPIEHYAELFPDGAPRPGELVGPPSHLAFASPVHGPERGPVRKASVLPYPTIVHAARRLLRLALGDYADVRLHFDLRERLHDFGLRDFVRWFTR